MNQSLKEFLCKLKIIKNPPLTPRHTSWHVRHSNVKNGECISGKPARTVNKEEHQERKQGKQRRADQKGNDDPQELITEIRGIVSSF